MQVLTQSSDRKFHISTILLLNSNFLTSNLHVLVNANSFLVCRPYLHKSSRCLRNYSQQLVVADAFPVHRAAFCKVETVMLLLTRENEIATSNSRMDIMTFYLPAIILIFLFKYKNRTQSTLLRSTNGKHIMRHQLKSAGKLNVKSSLRTKTGSSRTRAVSTTLVSMQLKQCLVI